jgi:hypothetical protein
VSDLLIAVCTLGKVRAEWATSLAIMKPVTGRPYELTLIQGMTTIDARNVAMALAVERESEYLVFYDDDMMPRDSDAVLNLVSAMERYPDIDVLGGVYPRRRSVPDPLVFKEENGGVWWGWEDGQIHEVYMTGTGFMCIRMERMAFPVETYELRDGIIPRFFDRTVDKTDDFYFADLCKANGRRQFVHGKVICDQMNIDGTRYAIAEKVLA